MKKEILIIFILLSSIASAQLADSPWPTFMEIIKELV